MGTGRTDDGGTIGSRSLTGRRRAPLGWLPWAALALLAVVGLLAFLVIRNVADAGDKAGVDVTNDRQGGATETGRPNPGDRAAPTSPGAGAPTGSSGETLMAGGQALLPLAAQGRLGALSGQAVTAKGVVVESVVSDEGFWLGPSATERVFVALLPQARGTAGESPFQVREGQRVELAGKLRPVPSNVASLGVEESEGAAQLRSQGEYIEATSVRLS